MSIILLHDRIYSMRICLIPIILIMLFTMRVKNQSLKARFSLPNWIISKSQQKFRDENYSMIAFVEAH